MFSFNAFLCATLTYAAPRQERRWSVTLVIPDPAVLESDSSDDEDEDEDESASMLVEEPQDDGQTGIGRKPARPPRTPEPFARASTEAIFPQALSSPQASRILTPPPLTPPPPDVYLYQPDEDLKPLRGLSPPIDVKPNITPEQRSRTMATPSRQSYRGSLDLRYPSPPPPTDKLGPAARYPYLPETDADGQPLYSCRIGGPRIFDLLNTLPLDEFGIMSWAIVDREEVLFEMDDIRDEDKVMMALWNRWIMINR